MEQTQKIAITVRLLKALVPHIDDALEYMQANGGWLPLSDQFLALIQNPDFKKWSEFYLDEKKIRAVTLLSVVDEDTLKGVTNAQQFASDLRADLADMLEDGDVTLPTEDELEQFKSEFPLQDAASQQKLSMQAVYFIYGFITGLFNYLALMIHGRTMCQLVADAISGDDDAYRRAVQIDRTVLYLPYFQDRMYKAQFSNDGPFLKSVGDSLKRPIISSKIRYRTLRLTFAILQDEGLLGLPREQLLDICQEVGVYGKAYGVEDVDHLKKRLRDYRKDQGKRNIF